MRTPPEAADNQKPRGEFDKVMKMNDIRFFFLQDLKKKFYKSVFFGN